MENRLSGRKSGEIEQSIEQSENLTVPMTSVMVTETTKLSTYSDENLFVNFSFKLFFRKFWYRHVVI